MWRTKIELTTFYVLIALSVLGGALRFVNLDTKEFWCDECCTALVLSGHTNADLIALVSPGIVHFSDLTPFRTVGEGSTPQNIVKAMCEDEPGHAPVFYFLEVLFCKLFGSTPFAMRLPSALISAFTLPIIFWLAYETYRSRVMAALATAFAALSPSLIYFAQEARDYSLGILFMYTSSAFLLCALRTSKVYAWIGYGASLLIGFYSWLFMLIAAAGQLLYVMFSKERRSKFWLPFCLTACASGVLLSPWLVVLNAHASNFKKAYGWIQPTLPLPSLINVWLTMPCKAFALFGLQTVNFENLLFAITLVELGAIVIAIRQFRDNVFLQICMIAAWFVVFGAQDVFLGGARSAPFRYQTIVICSTLIIFPALIEWLWKRELKIIRGLAVTVALFLFGIELLSSSYYLQERNWPNKSIKFRFTEPIAMRLNQEKESTIICEDNRINLAEILDLSYRIKSDTRLLYQSHEKAMQIPDVPEFYLWNPSPKLVHDLGEQGYSITDRVDGITYLKVAERKAK